VSRWGKWWGTFRRNLASNPPLNLSGAKDAAAVSGRPLDAPGQNGVKRFGLARQVMSIVLLGNCVPHEFLQGSVAR